MFIELCLCRISPINEYTNMLLSHYKDKEETNLSKVSGTKYMQKIMGFFSGQI